MSDNFGDIAKIYRKDVLPDYSRHSGLFPIPEYPEHERADEGMWSSALETLLTTLRYLAPATLLTLFWGQQSLLFRILKHIDLAIRAIVFSSDEQKQSVLKWLAEAGSVRVEHLDTVWRHGWILCNVLDAALPGACAGHPPTRQSLKHAQTIADHYLGVDSVFSNQELESNDCLSQHQEWKLAQYLERIREALKKISPPVSKPTSQRTTPMESTHITFDYAARGSGLAAAQVNNKVYFKIYPTAQQCLDPGEITILIRGPKDTYGMATIFPILGKAQLIRQKLMNLQNKPSFTENALPLTQGVTYLRSYGRNDMNKTYHIPKTIYDIEIDVEQHDDYAKIGYTVTIEGKYEISIVSKGHRIVGSPFSVTASNNIVGILEKDSFCLEDGEEIDILDIETDKKVVLRIVDFVTEKMLLKENGELEKISDYDANVLMATEHLEKKTKKIELNQKIEDTVSSKVPLNSTGKFNEVAKKVLKINRVCNVFHDISKQTKPKVHYYTTKTPKKHNHKGIPDVVNSTFSDAYMNPFATPNNPSDFIKFGDTPVSIVKDNIKRFTDNEIIANNKNTKTSSMLTKSQSLDMSNCTHQFQSMTNPFLDDSHKSITNSEYFVETLHKPRNELDIPIQIMVEEDDTPQNMSPRMNPFIDPEMIERPKTPVLKIITGKVTNRYESLYVDPSMEKITEDIMRHNEFMNPFFTHKHHQSIEEEDDDPRADFKIGAPVSLPPFLRSISPKPMDSSIMTEIDKSSHNKNYIDKQTMRPDETLLTVNSTALTRTESNANITSPFHSLDSIQECNENNLNQCEIQVLNIKKDYDASKKDMWDSAYVSIDENNSSPDNNNNDNESVSKSKSSLTDGALFNREELLNMGPAELELWTSCTELSINLPKINDDMKPFKWEIKRPTFTPILEENDRIFSASASSPEKSKQLSESDPVAVAFAELNDIFQEYASNSESSSLIVSYDDKIANSSELEYPIDDKDLRVKSASDDTADVMRPTTKKYEGKISEVQQNVTESVSVSQHLQNKLDSDQNESPDYLKFGQNKKSNIVLEKKEYWDERIRQIEEKKNEAPKRKKLISKKSRHNDSLTKRKGKQIAKNFMDTNESDETIKLSEDIIKDVRKFKQSFEEEYADPKLVEKWKKYWDEKLETEKEEIQVTCYQAKSPDSKEPSKSPSPKHLLQNANKTVSLPPVKQELSEELYKAFEESPKRFFGTSRKQILNKIDSFSGKPSTATDPLAEMSSASREKGIVSSRITQFHNISHVEDHLFKQGKSHSMHNIHYNPDHERKRYISLSANSTSDSDILTETESTKTGSNKDLFNANKNEMSTEPLKGKRLVMKGNLFSKSFDESMVTKKVVVVAPMNKRQKTYVQKTIKDINDQSVKQKLYSNTRSKSLQKTSLSKSELDIFSKMNVPSTDDNLDIHKSYDELPKINVKNFISMYESVTETAIAESSPKLKKLSRTSIVGSAKYIDSFSLKQGAENGKSFSNDSPERDSITEGNRNNFDVDMPLAPPRKKRWTKKANKNNDDMNDSTDSLEYLHNRKLNDTSQETQSKEKTFVSLSDIELEIISTQDNVGSTPEGEMDPTDYKSRFKLAKQYFQSIEDLKANNKRPKKFNECEELLYSKSKQSPEEIPQRRIKKGIKKSRSMPSSELSKYWKQMNNEHDSKLIKISEKFNVDDLFNDVMDGKLSRQGSLRGIPHKKAVLETFRSMENVAVGTMSSYEIAMSQLSEFAKENKIKNAQTYLTEYPYLPTTDPSKYHSRLDAKASGLITMKELLEKKPRRNSVPDLRVNHSFTIEL